jgi:hypothetical protein
MKYFKNEETGEVFAYETDGSQDEFIPEDLVQMTQEEVDLHLNPELTIPQKIQLIQSEIQKHMDEVARNYGYDDIKSAVTYAEEPSVLKFQDEGKAFRAWRSLVWAKAYELVGEFESGLRTTMTTEEVLLELPNLNITYTTTPV